jgi:hypothetical protein
MKNKLITLVAMLAVMVAMTGIAAAATQSHIIGTVLVDGIPYTAGAHIDAYSDSGRVLKIGEATSNAGGGFSMDTEFVDHVWLTGTAQGGLIGETDGNPALEVPGFNVFLVKLNLIPEFPTVALPVAAVIGLVFLFQQKKRKEE